MNYERKQQPHFRPDPCEQIHFIQEWMIEISASEDLTDEKRAAIERLDDHGFYSVEARESGFRIFIACDGEENELHNSIAELFGEFELSRINDNRWM